MQVMGDSLPKGGFEDEALCDMESMEMLGEINKIK
jgi:hypothetical protein